MHSLIIGSVAILQGGEQTIWMLFLVVVVVYSSVCAYMYLNHLIAST